MRSGSLDDLQWADEASLALLAAGHCIQLSRRPGFTVHGVEPVRRHPEGAARALHALVAAEPEIAARIRIYILRR